MPHRFSWKRPPIITPDRVVHPLPRSSATKSPQRIPQIMLLNTLGVFISAVIFYTHDGIQRWICRYKLYGGRENTFARLHWFDPPGLGLVGEWGADENDKHTKRGEPRTKGGGVEQSAMLSMRHLCKTCLTACMCVWTESFSTAWLHVYLIW